MLPRALIGRVHRALRGLSTAASKAPASQAAEPATHRALGEQLKLFMVHTSSPGSPFFLPHGTRVVSAILGHLRKQYIKRGYEEVISPHIYKTGLWQRSGHWDHYKENMYAVTPFVAEESADAAPPPITSAAASPADLIPGRAEGARAKDMGDTDDAADEFGLKPMNCPGHCLIFSHEQPRSHRELPMRLADFGALHRNESSGALTGLTRVRRFHQDDAHIFCTPEQMPAEIADCIDFVQSTYKLMGFGDDFDIELSTRPDAYTGSLSLWEQAEDTLRASLTAARLPFTINQGDGAFYGPKIDFQIKDSLGRSHQCATIQLDFNLPQQFALEYVPAGENESCRAQPVMIHRAVLGSVERFLAILLEHTQGKLPFWLSPRQVYVVPINRKKHMDYATKVADMLRARGIHVDVDETGKTLDKKVRHAQVMKYNYTVVVGFKEEEGELVAVRARGEDESVAMPLKVFVDQCEREGKDPLDQ